MWNTLIDVLGGGGGRRVERGSWERGRRRDRKAGGRGEGWDGREGGGARGVQRQ